MHKFQLFQRQHDNTTKEMRIVDKDNNKKKKKNHKNESKIKKNNKISIEMTLQQ